MTLKLLQLNIFFGKFIDNIIKTVNKYDYDILFFQEVSGGNISLNNQDDFEYLKEKLFDYEGVLVKNIIDGENYFGNALFYRKKFKVVSKEALFLTSLPKKIDFFKTKPQDRPYSAIIIKLSLGKEEFFVICAHMAWGPSPFDEGYKLKQATVLLEKIKKLKSKIILAGDFNLVSDTEIIRFFSKNLRNLTLENKVGCTLNTRVHNLGMGAEERRLAVDYIFLNPEIKVLSFKVLDEDLSDHLGLEAEIDI